MFNWVPLELYTPVYYYLMLLLVLWVWLKNSSAHTLHSGHTKTFQTAGGLLLLFVVFYMGLRPVSGRFFGDMGTYANIYSSYAMGFPVVLVESQSVGLPALISDSISNEVDLGVGLVHFESLKNNPSVWAEKLINSFIHKKGDSKQRIEKLAEQGFDIHTSVQRLMNLYDLMN